MSELRVMRIGFTGMDAQSYDGPEEALQVFLRRMEEAGHQIVSVSVLRSTRGEERYEAFVVSRHD